jgi:hypothetical protein
MRNVAVPARDLIEEFSCTASRANSGPYSKKKIIGVDTIE